MAEHPDAGHSEQPVCHGLVKLGVAHPPKLQRLDVLRKQARLDVDRARRDEERERGPCRPQVEQPTPSSPRATAPAISAQFQTMPKNRWRIGAPQSPLAPSAMAVTTDQNCAFQEGAPLKMVTTAGAAPVADAGGWDVTAAAAVSASIEPPVPALMAAS